MLWSVVSCTIPTCPCGTSSLLGGVDVLQHARALCHALGTLETFDQRRERVSRQRWDYQFQNFKRNSLEMEQFRLILRQKGIFSMFDVEDVLFETNGAVTVLLPRKRLNLSSLSTMANL